jgi:hypothetical protein
MTITDTINSFCAALDENLNEVRRNGCFDSPSYADEVPDLAVKYVWPALPFEARLNCTLDTAAIRDIFIRVVRRYGARFTQDAVLNRRAIFIFNSIRGAEGILPVDRHGDVAPMAHLASLVLAILWREQDAVQAEWEREAARERYAETFSGAMIGGASHGDALWIAQNAVGCNPDNDASWKAYVNRSRRSC